MTTRRTHASRNRAHRDGGRREGGVTRSGRSAGSRRRTTQPRLRLSRALVRLLASLYAAFGVTFAAAQLNGPLPAPAPHALPAGGHVIVGNGQISQSGAQMVIRQSSPRLGIDWQSFDIGAGASVEFVQPGADSVALNRVLGGDASQIYGRLASNGQVFLLNPNGVLFGRGAKVDVGGLVASALDLSQDDFAAGRWRLSGSSSAAVVNRGSLTGSAGGYVALLGRHVENQGEIEVPAGQVVLASGRAATVSISGHGLLSAVVEPGAATGSVLNGGSIGADGGSVRLSAHSAESLAGSLVNNTGIVRANAIVERNGEIWITGDHAATSGRLVADAPAAAGAQTGGTIVVKGDMERGSVDVAGTLSARSAGGRGGEIETSAAQVRIRGGTEVTTLSDTGKHGRWTIDPTNFTVSAGDGTQTSSGIGANTLASALNSGSVTLATANSSGTEAGDLFVQAPVTWTRDNAVLTLQAWRNVEVNASLVGTGAGAGLVVTPNVGNGGGTFTLGSSARVRLPGAGSSLQVAGVGYTMLRSIDDVQAINASAAARAGNYALADDIDAGATATWNNGAGFVPIGGSPTFSANNSFRGRLDGLGNRITGLVIDRPTNDYVGLIGTAHDATIRNLRLEGATITGRTHVGGIAGYAAASSANATPLTLVNVHSGGTFTVPTANVTAYAGALAGYFGAASGSIARSSSSGTISIGAIAGDAGGLVGWMQAGSVASSTSSANVGSPTLGNRTHGGLIGQFDGLGTVSDSSASGSVSNASYAGGLIGYSSSDGLISNVSASGAVSGSTYVGGLIGDWNQGGSITGATATGGASGTTHVGGLIGRGYFSGTLTNGVSSGTVTGDRYVGGLVGYLQQSSVLGTVADGTRSSATVVSTVASTATVDAGGLIGYFSSSLAGGRIENVLATGNVTVAAGFGSIGGLVGYLNGVGSAITGAEARGIVDASSNTINSRYTGGLVGQATSAGALTRVTAKGEVRGGYMAGGLVGYYTSSGAIDFAVAEGAVTGFVGSTSYVGGLVGYHASSGEVKNSSASGRVASSYDGGGLIGHWTSGSGITDSQASGDVTGARGAASLGGLVGYGASSGSIVNSSASGAVSGGTRAGGLAGYLINVNVDRGTASGRVSMLGDGTTYAGGLIGDWSNGLTTAAITNSTASGEVLADSASAYAGGLVGDFNGGRIAASSASGRVTARDSANTNFSSHYAGGLVASFNGTTITDSSASGAVTGRYMTGGLVGQYGGSGNLSNVSASGSVTAQNPLNATYYSGGLVGYLGGGGIATGFASGHVDAAPSASTFSGFVGGLVGYAYLWSSTAGWTISDSRATGAVSGGAYTGGLVGYLYDNSGTTPSATVFNSRATGNVSGVQYAGGLIGYYSYGSSSAARGIRSSFATGDVSAAQAAGGLVGYFDGYGGIRDSWASGNVTGTGSTGSTQYLGGLAGYYRNLSSTANVGLLSGSFASGRVALSPTATLSTFVNVYGGGLVGYLDGPNTSFVTLTDSYATGSVELLNATGRMTAGGLLGYTDTAIARTYSTGAVSATGVASPRNLGGLVGQRASTAVAATDSYWATDASGVATSVIGSARTLAQLQSASNYASTSWSVATSGGSSATWRLYDGRTTPLLRNLLTPLTLTLADIAKVYDGSASLGSGSIVVNNITVTNAERILVAGSTRNAGSYTIDAGNLYSQQNGYDLTINGSATLTVNRRPLTLDGLIADKVYDGGTSATVLTTPRLGGLLDGEDLVFQPGAGFSASFASKNAGADRPVTLSGNYTFGDGTTGRAANYLLPTAGSTTADILRAPLTAGSFAATNRVYDGTTTVAVSATPATLQGIVPGDNVAVDLTNVVSGTMADKNVGSGKAVTVSGAAITGADAGNYRLAGVDAVSVQITPRTATLNGITAYDRNYNASLNVSIDASAATLSGVVAGDQLAPRLNVFSGTIADKNVGNGKAVTVTGLGLRGADAGNYTLQQGPVGVNITPYPLTLSIYTLAASNRVYDGTTNASIDFFTTWWGNDNLTVSATSVGYADKNVAYNSSNQVIAKTITASGLAIAGTDAGNYTLQNTSATSSGTITPKPLTVSGVAAVNRIYDGTRDVTVNVGSATVDTSALIPGDQVTVVTPPSGNVTGQMADKNVGTNKPVTVPGLSLSGTDARNYTITGGGGVRVDIARKPVTVAYSALNKVYDGNVFATMNTSSADFIGTDSVTSYVDQSWCGVNACGRAQFAVAPPDANGNYVTSRHVGTAKPVVISSNFLVGTDAANYTLLNPNGLASADITPKPVTLAFSGGTRVYDGTTAAPVTLNFGASGVFSGDTLTTTQDAAFTGTDAKNVGSNKPIAVSNIVLGGANANNYIVSNTTAAASGAVTPKAVTVTGITAVDRAYDGTTVVAVNAGNVTSSGFVTGDQVAVALPPQGLTQGTIANKNVGVDKPVTVTGLSLSGADAPNYSIDANASGITVDITPAALTPTFSGVDRVYNGGISASVVSTTAGIFGGDVVNFSQQAVFTGASAKNVGSGKPIAVSNITISGAAAANYSLASTTATATASITPKPVTATYTGGSRVYNGVADVSAAVVGNSLQFVAGDQVGLTATARFTGDGSAGTSKPVSITGIALVGADGANYSLLNTTASTTATITPRPLGVTGITATSRVYDGTTTVAVNVANATVDTSTVIAGDDVRVLLPPSGISTGDMFDRHAGSNKPVNITGLALDGTAAANYALVGASGLTVNIAPRSVTAAWTGVGKVYDGSADASVTGSSTDLLAVDLGGVGFSAQGVFAAGRNAGVDKQIVVSGGFLTGTFRENYALANPGGTATATIAPRSLTVSYSGGSRVYDGGVAAPVTSSLGNRVAGDVVGTTQTAQFTGPGARNAGSNKPIAVGGIALTGADAGNYTLGTTSASATGTVTPKPITVSGLTNVTAVDRVYDGTTQVAVNVPANVTLTPDSSDIVSGDQVTIAVPPSGLTTGSMSDKHVGSGKAVRVDGLTLAGTDAANYVIEGTAGIRVTITPRSLTAIYGGVNKIYDGTAAATAAGTSAGILAGDNVSIQASGVFSAGKNVGIGKTIDLASATLGGSDARNYLLLNTTGTAQADIVARSVTPTFTGGSKVYDGSTAAPVSGGASGFVAGDSIGLDAVAVFTGAGAKNVGTSKPVAVSGITLTGSDAGNYTLASTTAATTASITPRPLTLVGLQGVTAIDRVYDGTRGVSVQVQATGPVTIDPAALVPGDQVAVAPVTNGLTTGTMQDKHAGQAKPVTVDGLSLTGADAPNYSVAATSGVTVNIAPRGLTATYTAASRVYDGTTSATVTGTSTDLLAGDVLTIGASGVFTGAGARNVGSNKPLAISGGMLAGADARNYTLLNPTGTGLGEITPRTVTASFDGGTRVYDGTVAAPVTGTLAGLIAGDQVTLGQSAVFTGADARNVGSAKPIAITGITLGGSDGINYSLSATTASATGGITPRPITVGGLTGVSATNRVYDGTRTVQVTIGASGPPTPNPGDIIAGDDVVISTPNAGPATGTMADKNAGLRKAVVVDGLGLSGRDAANYRIAGIDGVTVDIAPRSITASYAGASKVYDGTATIDVLGSSSDILAGDLLSITGRGLFSGAGGRNAGTGKPIEISGGVLAGLDAGNYMLVNTTAQTTGTITPRSLSVAYSGLTREYDGTAAARVQGSLGGLIAGDSVTLAESAAFTGPGARNAGTGKPIVVSGITLGGADAANYALTANTASTTGTITRKLLTISGLSGLSAVDRMYDGTRGVSITVASITNLTGDVIAGDDVTITAPANGLNAGTMADKHVGSNKAVTVSGLVLGGADAGNYDIGPTPGVTVNITPRPLQLAGVNAVARVYDGTRDVAVDTRNGVLAGAVVGDDVRLPAAALTAQTADKNAGRGKAVTVSGLALEGSDARNYSVVTPGLTVDIDRRNLVVSARAADRAYDGTTLAPVSFDSDRLAGDSLQVSADARFADKNAGRDKPVTLGSLSLQGADAANYQLGTPSFNLLASITPAALTITPRLQRDSKLYGDTFDFSGARFETSALVPGETVTTVSMSSAGAAASAGVSAIPYTVTLSDARGSNFDAANYAITYGAGQLTVLPRPLVVAGNSVVRLEGEPNPPSINDYFVNAGGLANGDRLASVRITVPPASAAAAGGSEFRITPSDARFAQGDVANYALTYADGLLLVVPKAQTGGGGLQVEIDRDQLERSLRELERLAAERTEAAPASTSSTPSRGTRAAMLPPAEVEALAATITLESTGGGARVTLPQLLRMPLISFDPALKRLIFGAEAPTP